METDKFYDLDGNLINSYKYFIYRVKGDALSPFNINNSNIVFVRPMSFYEFKQNKPNKGFYLFKLPNDTYIIRKVWFIGKLYELDIDNKINEIILSDKFKLIRNSHNYKSDIFIKQNINYPDCENICIVSEFDGNLNYKLTILNSEHIIGCVEHCFDTQ